MGPLAGIKILEMKGIGPGPYAGMLLADMGAEVVVVERSSNPQGIGIPSNLDPNSRGKRSIALDLKTSDGLSTLLQLVESADVLFEGFRPGVAERLGYGPDVCLERNNRLVYGRMTGWGQTGPLAKAAGHDINYISLTGSLAAIGGADRPVPPLNLVGDYAGGSLFLVMGHFGCIDRRTEDRQGTSRRRSDHRWLGKSDDDVSWPQQSGRMDPPVARPTCSMAVLTFMTCMKHPTASSYRLVQSSRSSMLC